MRPTFQIVHRLSFVLVLLAGSCAKDNNPVSNPLPPCNYCPVDFALIDFEPAWSPDGRTIAYVHGDREPGKSGIYLISPDGSNERQFYASPGASAPSWSPDGQWIAFHDQAQIYKIKSNGDSLTQLTFEGRNFFPAWSPDGQWIAYDNTTCGSATEPPPPNSCGVFVMKHDASMKKFIVRGRMPDWLPDGSYLLYVGLRAEIYRINISDTAQFVRLTSLNQNYPYARDNRYPKYSPEGRMIAFTSQPLFSWEERLNQIWVMNSDGTRLRQLTTMQGYSCDWSPDGEWIVYTDSRASNGKLWVMRKDGTMKRQLTFNN